MNIIRIWNLLIGCLQYVYTNKILTWEEIINQSIRQRDNLLGIYFQTVTINQYVPVFKIESRWHEPLKLFMIISESKRLSRRLNIYSRWVKFTVRAFLPLEGIHYL